MFKLEDRVVFTSYDDSAWGKEYGGKTAIVKEIQAYEDSQELEVEFEDGKCLSVMSYECILQEGDLHELS